jgi:hypothetical protein
MPHSTLWASYTDYEDLLAVDFEGEITTAERRQTHAPRQAAEGRRVAEGKLIPAARRGATAFPDMPLQFGVASQKERQMGNLVTDFLRKVFSKEEGALIASLQKRKLLVFALVVAVVVTWAYFTWTQAFTFLLIAIGNWLVWLALVWLAVLTFYTYRKDRVSSEKEFRDDFGQGLEKWEYYGDWKSEREGSGHILIVTNSDAGGLAKPCRLWNDYEFEFETKIVQSNSAWIIRASDILNYVMLQCGQGEIIPHFRVNGLWFKMPSIPLTKQLPLNEWFGVRIRVSGTRVVATAIVEMKEMILLDRALLEPQIVSVQTTQGTINQQLNLAFSFPLGSVGFREWGNTECAHFRNVRVSKI